MIAMAKLFEIKVAEMYRAAVGDIRCIKAQCGRALTPLIIVIFLVRLKSSWISAMASGMESEAHLATS